MTKLKHMLFMRGIKDKVIYEPLGVSPATFSLLKNGKRRLGAEEALIIADILDCEPADIIGNIKEHKQVAA